MSIHLHGLCVEDFRIPFNLFLNHNVSLSDEEKERVINAIPQLTQEQIDEVIMILEEEKQKLKEVEINAEDDAINELLKNNSDIAYTRAVVNLKRAKQTRNDQLIYYYAFTLGYIANKLRPYSKLK